MRLSTLALFLFFTGVTSSLRAQTPTWASDIAPILYNNCASCHHNGGIAPFELMTYGDAVAHAGTMKSYVNSGKMPPWPPDATYSHFAHERRISASDKAKISAWVDGGTPQGNISLAPPQPTFSTTGDLPGTADLTVRIPNFTSTALNGDLYRCFVLDPGQTADKFITAFEAIPGDRSIVHHVLVYADTTGVSTQKDAADPGPGYTSFGGIGTNQAILLGGWVPGTTPVQFPSGFGVKLPHNAKIVIQIHYPVGSNGKMDSTKVRFFFSPTNNIRNVLIMPVLNHDLNITPTLSIPANTVKTFNEQIGVPIDLTVMGIAPHMHLIGRNIKSFGVLPTGDTQKYISIPDWDFHWQGFYFFKKMLKLPAGTTAYGVATYDNTTNNPSNPSNPPLLVQAGESTTDEMMLIFFLFTPYLPGDENIVIDGTTPVGVPGNYTYYNGNQLLQPYPVPTNNEIIAKMYFEKSAQASLDIVNSVGQIVANIFNKQTVGSGYQTYTYSVASLPAGTYQLRLTSGDNVQTQKIVVVH